VKRLPIRARLTAAFALAMALMLAAAALFVYLRMRADLDESVNQSLHARAAALVAGAGRGRIPAPLRDDAAQPPDERVAQVLTPEGRLLDAVGGARRPVLGPAELRRATAVAVTYERTVPGMETTIRVLARPTSDRPGAPVLAVGQSLGDRNEALAGLVTSFIVGGPLAIGLAAIIGYALATAGLAPVEAMRRQAAQVSLSGKDARLPLPAAHDEIRRLGETLNDMLGRLRGSFERERQFVADASHELRTPVAVLKTELEGALRTGDYGPEVREALVAAIEECDHLAQLAEDLLVLARSEDGQLPMRLERLQAQPLCAGVRERFIDRATERGRRIRVDAPEDLDLWADPLRLRQALGNLVDNALRHGDGDVLLHARSARAGVELEVADEGAGFADDIAQRAFERFTRGDAARSRGGAGLGLAIVRAIAEAHGGAVETVPGPGARVRIWMPVPAGWQAPSRPSVHDSNPSQADLSSVPYGGPDGAPSARTADPEG
jgi:two-component system OmpR family sensor kinase